MIGWKEVPWSDYTRQVQQQQYKTLAAQIAQSSYSEKEQNERTKQLILLTEVE